MTDNLPTNLQDTTPATGAAAPMEATSAATGAAAPMEATSAAVAELVQHAKMMDASYQLAQVLSNTGMVPKTYWGKPDDAAAAIMYGAEIGLKPIQALQNIFVVNGKPAIYGRTMQAILVNRGFRFKTVTSTDMEVTVEVTAPDGCTETSTWTIGRAEQAGYTKNDRYEQDPQAMLYAKAITEVSRKIAPNLLLGMPYSVEEMRLEEAKQQQIPYPVKKQSSKQNTTPAPDESTPKSVDVDSYMKTIEAASTRDELKAIMSSLKGVDRDTYQELSMTANERWEQLKN